ncbi:MAG: 3-phosphoshikimate 1-carboxyvinyltransferase [Chloroflexota bacterium]
MSDEGSGAGSEAGAGHGPAEPVRVRRSERLAGELRLPGDKSIGHRALLFNALAEGEAEVTTFRPGADVRSSASSLDLLGALISTSAAPDGTMRYVVCGGGTLHAACLPGAGDEILDCGNSGTTMRLFSGALAGRPLPVRLGGDASLSRRPMERVAAPLRRMGAAIDTTEGHAPIHITGARPLAALTHELPVASAQVLGAVLLAGLAADGRTVVDVPGPTRDHTERLLAWMGVPIARDGLRTTIEGPAGFRARSLVVPGDISSAGTWLVAGAVHPSAEIRLRHVALNPTRLAIVDVLREMGADVTVEPDAEGGAGPEPTGDLVVRGGRPLQPIHLAGPRVAELIDELPVLAIAMAAAEGTSELHDAGELRVKESDRIALMVEGLRAIGVDAEELPDGWRIRDGRRTATAADATITTAGDHRIAMAFSIAALGGVAGTVTLDDGACVDVSYHGFWEDLAAIAGSVSVEHLTGDPA